MWSNCHAEDRKGNRCSRNYGNVREPARSGGLSFDQRLKVIGKDTNDAIHDVAEGGQDDRGGRPADREGSRGDGKVQRRTGQGGRAARRRWPSTELEGREGHVPERQAPGDRRPLRRNEGADRRLLDDPGQVEGRGYRMGEAACPSTHPPDNGRAPEIELRQMFEVTDFPDVPPPCRQRWTPSFSASRGRVDRPGFALGGAKMV